MVDPQKNHLPFKALKKTRLYEDVANQIKQAIFRRQLKPGDRLPSERELSELFNVGRPTIREALRSLSVMGLIKINRGARGSMVIEGDITQYLEAMREQLAWLIKTDQNTLQELWEVRKYIELGISHSVANRGTAKDIKNLERLFKKMEACGDDIDAYFNLAVQFHQELALASKNKIFLIIWEMFHDILLKGYLPRLRQIFPGGPAKLLKANRVLLEAIKRRSPAAIEEAMKMHADEEKFFPPHPEIGTGN